MLSKKTLLWTVAAVPMAVAIVIAANVAVPQGSPEKARAYYETIAGVLKFDNGKSILESTLDDVPKYLGYAGLSAGDLERLPSAVLMDPSRLGRPCDGGQACDSSVEDTTAFALTFSVLPLRQGDILSSRFLAPKIANVADPSATRSLGWRKLVRLRARNGSDASKRGITGGIILFNFFTKPGEKPFEPQAESVNTQVMLLTARSSFVPGERDSLYWLDYGPRSKGFRISLELDASFDAADLQGTGAVKPYFVPDGCVACHGENPSRSMVNYLDTDHWFDRLDDDFARVREEGLPVLFDGGNDVTQPSFVRAFDVIREFNEEAAAHAAMAQSRSFHRLASLTWLRLHRTSNDHVPIIQRGVGTTMRWNATSENDRQLLGLLNRYCFRCHGTISFNVFDKSAVYGRRAPMARRLNPTPEQLAVNPGSFLMPPDRKLDVQERDRLLLLLRAMEAK